MKILVIEDEERLAAALYEIFDEQKYQSDLAFDGVSGLELALHGDYDIIILDGMLPRKDGFDVIRDLRNSKVNTPVLMLTARDDIHDKIKGLDLGADDYMTKPFIPEELLARVRALSRRQGEILVETLDFAGLSLSLSNSTLTFNKKNIQLSFKEFEILKILMSNPNNIISKDTLISKVWGDDSDAEDNNVEAYISFIRKKLLFLETDVVVTTIRKLGYKLELSQN